MCRLQHSLGIMWRPRAPPLTAPTSNGSAQPCRPGPGAGGPSSHAGRSGRCQSVACSRGAHAGLYGGLPRRPAGGGAGSSRGGGPGAWLPGAGGPPSSPAPPCPPAEPARPGRPGPTRRSAALGRPTARAGAAPAGTQPWAPAWPPAPGPPLPERSASRRVGAERLGRPGRVGPVRW